MPRRVFRVVFGNLRLKLWALAISVGIWFYASSQITEEAKGRAGLNVVAPPGYALLYQSEDATRITVAGPRSVLDGLRNELAQQHFQLTYRLTEQEASAGWSTLRVRADWMRPSIPEKEYVQLSLREVTPAEVTVFVNPVRERTLPVEVRASVHLRPGFRLVEEPTCLPPEVKVRGPAIAVDAMKAVQTAELVLYDIQESVHRLLALPTSVEAMLSNGMAVPVPLQVDPPTAVASILVTGEEERDQTFEGVPVLLLVPPGFPYQAEFAQGEDKVTVRVRASPANLAKLGAASIKAYVDLGGLAREKIEPGGSAPYKERAEVSLPADVVYSMAQAQPERLTILLKNRSS